MQENVEALAAQYRRCAGKQHRALEDAAAEAHPVKACFGPQRQAQMQDQLHQRRIKDACQFLTRLPCRQAGYEAVQQGRWIEDGDIALLSKRKARRRVAAYLLTC